MRVKTYLATRLLASDNNGGRFSSPILILLGLTSVTVGAGIVLLLRRDTERCNNVGLNRLLQLAIALIALGSLWLIFGVGRTIGSFPTPDK